MGIRGFIAPFVGAGFVAASLPSLPVTAAALGSSVVEVDAATPMSAADAEVIANQLESSDLIVAAEPDYVATISADAVQADPAWSLDRIDQRTLPLDRRYGYSTSGAGVDAYVVDTGVRSDHQEFAGRVKPGFTAHPDGFGTDDPHGHGTHVAVTIAGSTYGVAKAASIVPVRVLNTQGSGSYSDIIAGINWIINTHVAVPRPSQTSAWVALDLRF